jgi:hypothetical protein
LNTNQVVVVVALPPPMVAMTLGMVQKPKTNLQKDNQKKLSPKVKHSFL